MSNTFRDHSRSTLLVLAAAVTFLSCTDGPPTAPQFPRPRVAALASPPPSVPSSVYDETNVIHDTPRMAGRFLRNTLVLLFQPGTSASARDSAVNSVQGSVVGGILLTADDGVYMVQVPDDGTDGPLFSAISTLSAMPQVLHAGPELLLDSDSSLAYLAPHDGTTWSNWKLSPDSATGTNWAPEAIAAPLAWGCATGDSTVPIAVVDHGFHSIPDIDTNVTSTTARNVFTADDAIIDTYHGDAVTSILAARGDNGTGMTGIMWRASVRQYEAVAIGANGQPTTVLGGRWLLPSSTIVAAAVRAAFGGAAIINVSWEIRYKLRGQVMTRQDSAKANALGSQFAGYMRFAGFFGHSPLLVVAAGNSTVDATFSGYPQAAADPSVADRVLVVGASRRTSQPSSNVAWFSNTGSLVQIAAPGDSVVTLTPSGAERQWSGTSFSAPAVTGVAGLMLSLDPTLSAADLKRLLIAGAVSGQRTAGGIPILNAYESLKLVAQRTTAGLCGNRVWADGNNLVVQRAAGTTQTIFKSSSPVLEPAVKHGSRIQFGGHDVAFHSGIWVDSWVADTTPPPVFTWPPTPPPPPAPTGPVDTIPGGTTRSFLATSHAGDSTAGTSIVGNVDFPTGYQVSVASRITGVVKLLTTLPAAGAPLSQRFCYAQTASTSSCQSYIDVGGMVPGPSSMAGAAVAYSPYGNEVFVSIPYTSNHASAGGWSQCGYSGSPNDQCRLIHVRRTTDSSVTWAVSIPSGVSIRLWSTAAKKAFYLGAAEGTVPDLVAGLGTADQSFDYAYNGPSTVISSTSNCGYAYKTRAGGAPEFIPNADVCSTWRPATMAPQRSVTGARLWGHP